MLLKFTTRFQLNEKGLVPVAAESFKKFKKTFSKKNELEKMEMIENQLIENIMCLENLRYEQTRFALDGFNNKTSANYRIFLRIDWENRAIKIIKFHLKFQAHAKNRGLVYDDSYLEEFLLNYICLTKEEAAQFLKNQMTQEQEANPSSLFLTKLEAFPESIKCDYDPKEEFKLKPQLIKAVIKQSSDKKGGKNKRLKAQIKDKSQNTGRVFIGNQKKEKRRVTQLTMDKISEEESNHSFDQSDQPVDNDAQVSDLYLKLVYSQLQEPGPDKESEEDKAMKQELRKEFGDMPGHQIKNELWNQQVEGKISLKEYYAKIEFVAKWAINPR